MASFSINTILTSATAADIASRHEVNITYIDVTKCFDSIPFNKEAARVTLESVTTLFNDYYISRDAAMAPFLAKPLQSDPVDIAAKFRKIGHTQYTSDRKFHTDVYEAIKSLHDGHAMYFPYCYMAYQYQQPLSLYAGRRPNKAFEGQTGSDLDREIFEERCCWGEPCTLEILHFKGEMNLYPGRLNMFAVLCT
ncbi:hypothetical protein BGZ91_002072 [Linnemannia elongata]|nr:hypothetical protein BGZ91_002072 [Linnemannia elongata]